MKQSKAHLGVEKLTDVVTSSEFGSRLASSHRYTQRERREAAFAVYEKDGGVRFSRVLRATPEDTWDNESEGKIGGAISVGDITHRFGPDDEEGLRLDLALLIHTHTLETTPRPSPGDLDLYEARYLSNPDILEGVLTRSNDVGRISLLLYRASPCRDFMPQILQAMNPEVYPTLEAMHEAGLNAVTLECNPKTGQLVTDPSTLRTLYA